MSTKLSQFNYLLIDWLLLVVNIGILKQISEHTESQFNVIFFTLFYTMDNNRCNIMSFVCSTLNLRKWFEKVPRFYKVYQKIHIIRFTMAEQFRLTTFFFIFVYYVYIKDHTIDNIIQLIKMSIENIYLCLFQYVAQTWIHSIYHFLLKINQRNESTAYLLYNLLTEEVLVTKENTWITIFYSTVEFPVQNNGKQLNFYLIWMVFGFFLRTYSIESDTKIVCWINLRRGYLLIIIQKSIWFRWALWKLVSKFSVTLYLLFIYYTILYTVTSWIQFCNWNMVFISHLLVILFTNIIGIMIHCLKIHNWNVCLGLPLQ